MQRGIWNRIPEKTKRISGNTGEVLDWSFRLFSFDSSYQKISRPRRQLPEKDDWGEVRRWGHCAMGAGGIGLAFR